MNPAKHAEPHDDVDILNEQLAGSPYLLANDEYGKAEAKTLVQDAARLERRSREIEASFKAESREIRQLVTSMIETEDVYESNAIEGLGLSLARTKQIVDRESTDLREIHDLEDFHAYLVRKGLITDPHLVDILGLSQANQFAKTIIQDFRDSSTPIRETHIRELHSLIVPAERYGGAYRNIDVQISGSSHKPSATFDIAREMNELTGWINRSGVLPPLASAVIHSWLTHIHPFQDGNGRMARLLANIALLRADWPPLIVRASDRVQYLDALAHSDSGGDLLPVFRLFVKSMERNLMQLEKPELARRLFEADLAANEDRRYQMWFAQMSTFLDHLGRQLAKYKCDLTLLVVPSASTMLLLEENNPNGRTWLATLRRSDDGREFLIWLGSMSARQRNQIGIRRTVPSIFFSQDTKGGDSRRTFETKMEDSPLPIDEITLLPVASEGCAYARFGGRSSKMAINEAADQVALFFSRAIPAG